MKNNMKTGKAQNIERIEEPEINRLIALRFLEKLEKMSDEERKTIIRTIQLIITPIFKITKDNKTK
ncbi:MAG: hypothetical protein U9O91_06455 [Candidatus Caldatribacteriota bacterium]|nr:hypothetical protein [Candidatus Caldatribacteriota bacterium]